MWFPGSASPCVYRWSLTGGATRNAHTVYVPVNFAVARHLSVHTGPEILAGKMGWAIPFDGESFAGGAGGARLRSILFEQRA